MSVSRRSQRTASAEPISYAPARSKVSNGSRRGNAPPTPTANTVRVTGATGQRPVAVKESTAYGAPVTAGPAGLEQTSGSFGAMLATASRNQDLGQIDENEEAGEDESEMEDGEGQSPALAARNNRVTNANVQRLNRTTIARTSTAAQRSMQTRPSNAQASSTIINPAGASPPFAASQAQSTSDRSYTEERVLAKNADVATNTPIHAATRRTSTSNTTTFRINRPSIGSNLGTIRPGNISASSAISPRASASVTSTAQLPADINAQLSLAAKIAEDQRKCREAEDSGINRFRAWVRCQLSRSCNLVMAACNYLDNVSQWARHRFVSCGMLFAILGAMGFLLYTAPAFQRFREEHPSSVKGLYQDISHHIQYYMPQRDADFDSGWYAPDVSALTRRISKVEHQVKSLLITKQNTMEYTTLQELKDALPASIIVSKDKDGKLVLSPEFWRAIHAKGKQDQLREEGLPDDIVNAAAKGFEDWYKKNDAKVKMWLEEYSYDIWNEQMQEYVQGHNTEVTRDDVIRMISTSYETTHRRVEREMNELRVSIRKDMNFHISRIGSTRDTQTGGLSKRQVQDIARDALDQIIPGAQLQALAKVMLRDNTAAALTRYNFFSEGSGASINPVLTTTTYDFSKERAIWFVRWALTLLGNPAPTPHPSRVALQRWQEAGDCWCAPSSPTAPIQLAITVPKPFYLDQIVIEHVLPDSTLDIASAPKRVEVLIRPDDFTTVVTLTEIAARLFPARAAEQALDENWVPVAQFDYDASRGGPQVFETEVNLKDIKASTKEVIIRVLENQENSKTTCLYRVRAHGELAPVEVVRSVYVT